MAKDLDACKFFRQGPQGKSTHEWHVLFEEDVDESPDGLSIDGPEDGAKGYLQPEVSNLTLCHLALDRT